LNIVSDAISKFLDWIKSPRQSAIAFVTSVVLLLVPSHARQTFGLQPFERYRGHVFVSSVFFGAVLLVELIYLLANHIKTKRRGKAIRRESEEYLRTLSPEEKGIMLEYMRSTTDTQYLFSVDGKVGSLLGKGLIYSGSRTGQMTRHGPRRAYNIQPWVKEYINSHPEILEDAQEPAPPPSPFLRSWME
jgi:Super-infection exclusion protein B